VYKNRVGYGTIKDIETEFGISYFSSSIHIPSFGRFVWGDCSVPMVSTSVFVHPLQTDLNST